jgi:hypothetical protein
LHQLCVDDTVLQINTLRKLVGNLVETEQLRKINFLGSLHGQSFIFEQRFSVADVRSREAVSKNRRTVGAYQELEQIEDPLALLIVCGIGIGVLVALAPPVRLCHRAR